MHSICSFAALVATILVSGADARPQGWGGHQHQHSGWGQQTSSTAPSSPADAAAAATSITTETAAAGVSSPAPYAPYAASSGFAPLSAGVQPTGVSPTGAIGTGSPSNASASSTPTSLGELRGVNAGGWLVLEKWENPDVFSGSFSNAVDQYTFDEMSGAEAALQQHWSTFFTEADVAKIASWGLNAIRIPIGYWSYNNTGTPYIKGADVYLEKAIGWARNYGIKVLVDCHGSPGSQNGFDNSGHAGDVSWQSDNNLQLSIDVLQTMAEKYGAMEYADVVFALELVNEPISWNENNFTKTKQWAQEAYQAVKAKAANPDLIVIMHDGFMGPSNWVQVGDAVNGNASYADAKFAMDVHLYQNQEEADKSLTQPQHIAKACNWTNSELLPASASLPVYVGEFSAATDICANPDGTTFGGTTCTVSGCTCADGTSNITEWNTALKDATRKFLEAQIQAFEHSAAGWFLWTYKDATGGAWALQNIMSDIYDAGEKLTDFKFPNVCNFTTAANH